MNISDIPFKCPIIAFAPHPWNEPEWMNRQQLLSRLGARGWPVIYSTGVMDFWDRGKAIWHAAPWLGKIESRDDVFVAHAGRATAQWHRFRLFDEFSIRQHSRWLCSNVVSRNDEIIVMVFHPRFLPYLEYLQPCKIVFHAYDAYAQQPGWDEQLERFQGELVVRSSLVTASSPAIARNLAGAKEVRILPNGADVDMFRPAAENPEPNELKGTPRPRICYTGAINRKVDLPLVAEIALARPDWQWVFLGEVKVREILADTVLAPAYETCRKLPNIHFLGLKNRHEIPAFVAYMDVNVMCYRSDGVGWWHSGYPLKLHEYLAVGKPVVSVDLEVVLPFQSVIAIARTVEDWVDALGHAIDRGGVGSFDERRMVAERNSWDSRVDQLEEWLLELF